MQPRGQFDTGIDAGKNKSIVRRAEPGQPARLGVRSLAARGLAAVLLAALLALLSQAQAQTLTLSIGAETDGTGDAEGVEGDTIELTVKLSAVSAGAVTAKWRYVSGTARSADYDNDGNQNLSIAVGQTTATVSVDLVDDTRYEGEESFEIELYDVVGATIARERAQITIKVDTNNPDLPSFRVDQTTVDVNEDDGTVTVQVVHDAFEAQDVDITITYETADDTATQPDDYTATSGTLTFPAGPRVTRTVTIPIVNDTDEEGDETFEVRFGAPSVGASSVGAFDSGGARATVTIKANDPIDPTNATLSGLALKNAADDSAIDLNETFATGTIFYTADVLNAVDEITVEPTSDHNATFAYLNALGTALTDAGLNKAGFQAALAVGATTIKVKVTAEGMAATETYTLVVTRRPHLPTGPDGESLVLETWPLVPAGLEPGDTFRLVFLTSSKSKAESTEIVYYNRYVQDRVEAAVDAGAAIRPYDLQFKAIASTAAVNARDNTQTGPLDTDAPIYWLNGNKAADNYADMYDGTWDDEANRTTESGIRTNTIDPDLEVWTGSRQNGTERRLGMTSHALGTSDPAYGKFSVSGGGPIYLGESSLNTISRRLIGLSPIFRVVAPKVRFGSTGYHAIEGGAEATVAVSMYPRPITQVDIPLTVTNLDSTTAADYQIFVNGSQVLPGSPLSLTFSPDDRDSGGGGIAQRFTVRAVSDLANDHRERVKFGFDTEFSDLLSNVLIEGETDGRAAKTATVWLVETQTEMMACRTPPGTPPGNSVPSLGKLRDTNNPRRLNSKGEIKNSGDCVWYKVYLTNNRRHQIEYSDRWVQTNAPGQTYTSVLSQITSPQIKVYKDPTACRLSKTAAPSRTKFWKRTGASELPSSDSRPPPPETTMCGSRRWATMSANLPFLTPTSGRGRRPRRRRSPSRRPSVICRKAMTGRPRSSSGSRSARTWTSRRRTCATMR